MHTGPAEFSVETRRQNLARLQREHFDVLVIGGGITGAGIARHLALEGYRVALVEKGDFAGGASSKSSKLVHGGLRYLKTGDLRLVHHACQQRRELLLLARHLVRPLPFLLPAYREAPGDLLKIRLGMWLYDGLAAFRNIERHQIWPAPRALSREPFLNPTGLLAAARYYDCATDDARLTLATIVDAHRMGATVANAVEVAGLLRARNRVVGAQVRDRLTGAELEVMAHLVVSAVGPWTDDFLQRTGPREVSGRWLCLRKGVHIVVPRWKIPGHDALIFRSPRDRRHMFLIPWQTRAIIGTTETDYSGDPDEVFATAEDVAYVLEAARQAFPGAQLWEDDVVSAYAGLRPLLREDDHPRSELSRDHRITEALPGLIAIAGGKLTTHRLMARDVAKEVARRLHPRGGGTNGAAPPLPGGDVGGHWNAFRAARSAALAEDPGLPGDVAGHLVSTYGSEATHVAALLDRHPGLAERLTPDLPVIKAQAVHAVRHEMALTLADVLDRRTQVMTLAADNGASAAAPVADLMATELGWTPEQREAQIARYRYSVALMRRWREP